jgi:hypothetical protein
MFKLDSSARVKVGAGKQVGKKRNPYVVEADYNARNGKTPRTQTFINEPGIDHDACCSEEANGTIAKSGLDNKIIIPNILAYYISQKVCEPPIDFQRRARHDVIDRTQQCAIR